MIRILKKSPVRANSSWLSFTLVLYFYIAWCGHCKNLAPIYEQVAEIFSNEPNCIVANLDATAAEETAKEYDVQGYPTIKLLTPKGGFKDYSGGRTVADFVKYLNAECGTHRTITGDVDESAGLIKELGDFATQFFKTEASQLDKLLEAGEVEANNHPTVKTAMFYIRALKKYLADSSYLEKESNRLGGIIDKGALTREKRDDFMSRRNVLNSLIAAKTKSKVGGHEEL